MQDPVLRVVLFPRYSALYGTTPLYSTPVNVKAFAKVLITAWKSVGLSSDADVVFTLEQSTDLGVWHSIGSLSPASPGQEATATMDLQLEWVRLKAVVSGSMPGVTAWAIGALVPREAVGG